MENDKLKIIAFSDYRIHNLDYLINHIKELKEKPDLILYAGDDTKRFNNPENKRNKNYFQILASLSKYGLGAVIGNDCDKKDYKLIKGKKVFDLHRKNISLGKFYFIGQEGTEKRLDLNLGSTLYSFNEIKNKLKKRLKFKTKKKIILISHSPPYRSLDFSMRFGKSYIGSKAIREIIQNNNNIILNICGHSHLNGGKEDTINNCKVINVSNHDNIYKNFFPLARMCTITLEKEKIIQIKWIEFGDDKREKEKNKSLNDYYN